MSECLSFSQIMRFAERTDSASSAEEDHLRQCPRCRGRLEMASDDDLLERHIRLAEQEIRQFAGGLAPVIGDYRLVREIGRGGMGVIYEAVQQSLNRSVALKVLPAVLRSLRPESAERFKAEAAAAARLKHPNIVPIYDYGQEGDCHYYAMELVEGFPLSEVIRQYARLGCDRSKEPSDGDWAAGGGNQQLDLHAPLDSLSQFAPGVKYYRRVAHWIAEVADALQFAHDRGVVHRDIKPSNLILSRAGRLMISDFGLAKDVNDQAATQTGHLMGTWRYMSPEQIRDGGRRVDHRTDIYSLGATMYEWLTLQPVIPVAPDYEMPQRVLDYEPPPPDRVIADVPRQLALVCGKALAKTVQLRYHSAAEMGADLRRFLNDEPISAREPDVRQRVIRLVRKNRSMIALALVALLLATSVISTAGYMDLARERAEMRTTATAFLVSRAKEHLDEGRFNVAVNVYSNALARDPELAYVYASRAVAYGELGRFGEAVNDLSSAIELSPQRPGNYFRRGVLRLMGGSPRAAIADFESAIALHPADDSARFFRYLCLTRAGHHLPDDEILIGVKDGVSGGGHGAVTSGALASRQAPDPALLEALATARGRVLVHLFYAEQALDAAQAGRAAELLARSIEADDTPNVVRQYCRWRLGSLSAL